MGIFGQNPLAPMGMQAMDPRSMQQQDPRIGQAMKGPGFFGAGGQGRNLIGIIGDALAAAGGGRPYYGPAMLQQQQQDRQDEREDERWENRFKLQQAAKQTLSTPAYENYQIYKGLPEAERKTFGAFAMPPRPTPITNEDGSVTWKMVNPMDGLNSAPSVQPGAIEDGYKFNGGDPADPNSWSKL